MRGCPSTIPFRSLRVVALLGFAISPFLSTSSHGASVPAETLIRNQAEAIYFDPLLGIQSTVYSNTVEAIVGAVPALSLTGLTELILSRGAIGQYYFDLENTGNTPIEARLAISDTENAALVQNGRLVRDLNGNGRIDPTDPVISVSDLLTLGPGERVGLIYEFHVSSVAPIDATLSSVLTATGIAGDETLSISAHGVTRLVEATLEIEKEQAVAAGETADRLTYTLHLRNNSDAPVAAYDEIDGQPLLIDGVQRAGVLLRDEIPLNTVFAAPVTGGGMEELYHIAGDEPHDYVTTLPSDLSTIDAVAFFSAGDYTPGTSRDPAFEVTLSTALGDVTVENTARVSLSPELTIASNETVHQRDTDAEALLRFIDPETGDDMPTGVPGEDTRLALFSGACNRTSAIDTIEITLVSLRTGDTEIVTATETGANTGIFTTADVVLAEMLVMRAGDGVMATTRGDEIRAFADCGADRITDTLPVVPGTFLFNSVTNVPIEGIAVTLIDAETGALMGMTVTDRQGFFAFPPVSEGTYAYRLVGADGWIYPSARTDFTGYGRLITEAGYGESFVHEGGTAAPSDIPVDPYYAVPLSLTKQAERDQVGTGEILTYTLTLTNNMYQAIMYTRLLDDLPSGVTYVEGSARFEGEEIADPQRDATGDLTFDLGTIEPLDTAVLTYAVRFTAAAREGRNMNTALFSGYQAGTGTLRSSEVARAVVELSNAGGVFSREGTVIGSVFMDCDGNGIRGDATEPGVPGVRIVTDRGLSVVTDIDGKYSLFGLSPVTHAFLVQPETLPAGTEVKITRTNDLGAGGSRLIPLRKGELRAEHFALEACSTEALAEVEARRTWFEENATTEALTAADLPLVGRRAPTRSARTEAGIATKTQLSPEKLAREAEARDEAQLVQKAREIQHRAPLAQLLRGLDNTAGFIELEEGTTLTRSTTNIRVKANMALTLALLVNGREIEASRIGERASLASRDIQALEFVAVDLRGGENILTLIGRDPFGNERERVEMTVTAPGAPARIEIVAPETASADPTTPIPVVLRLLDARGNAVPASAVVTLEARRAIWDVADIRPDTPGIQAFIDNGEATFNVIAPQVSGPDRLSVRASFDAASVSVDFTPNLDERIMIGVIEGAVNFGGSGKGKFIAADEISGFEDTTTGLRGSLYLKGAIKGEALLTLRYNSDRDTEARLFRDIRGDEYYPVYGDRSERGYDAQSASNLYVKVEKGRSYVLYGDIDIAPESPAFKLGATNRVVTGGKAYWANERTSVSVFAANVKAEQRIVEIAGRGVSGPYTIDLNGYVEGSERVEILVRDEDGGDVISAETMRRGTDYLLNFFSNTITFDTPVHQFDEFGNPVSIRVTYEVEAENAERYWLYGGEVNHALTERTKIGARIVNADAKKGTDARMRLAAAYVTHEAENGGLWEAEIARSEDQDGETGNAARVAYERKTETSSFKAEAIYTDKNFKAPGAITTAGQTQLRASYSETLSADSAISIAGEAIYDRTNKTSLHRLEVLYDYQVSPQLGVEIGAEYERRKAGGETDETTSVVLGADWSPQHRKNTNIVARLRYPVSGEADPTLTLSMVSEPKPGWRAYKKSEITFGDGIVSTRDSLGFDYRLNEFLHGTFDLSRNMGDPATTYTQGLNGIWKRGDFTTFTASIEHSRELETSKSKLTSVALGAKWEAKDQSWIGDADLDATFEPEGATYYASLGLAGKISDDLTFLGRTRVALDKRNGEDHSRIRTRLGLAYRPMVDPRLEVLAWYENRVEKRDSESRTHMWSVDASYEATADLRLNGKYAGQHQSYRNAGSDSESALTQLVQGGLNYEFGGDRFQIGVNASHLWDDTGSTSSGFGAEIGFVPTKGTLIALGYNRMQGSVASQSELHQAGFYLRFSLLLDNSLADRLDGFLGN
ncbi:hypothetical protein ACSBLW_11485 [Thioclava sp. FR2]|uniref:hypothetical protein n=1 Tax=Thioclava sp. FR2 TaxID=3445780 RepID=UPI003EBF1149